MYQPYKVQKIPFEGQKYIKMYNIYMATKSFVHNFIIKLAVTAKNPVMLVSINVTTTTTADI